MDLAEIDLTGSDSTEFPCSPVNDDNPTQAHARLLNGPRQKFNGDAFETASTNCQDGGWANSYSEAGVVLGTDRKRCRRAMFDESAIEDIMGQSKFR
jgi:hypothetical protein